MVLRELNIYKESFPFDSVPTTPKLIRKYIQDSTEFFPQKNIVRNNDGVWFGHFDINEHYETTVETFKRRFQRLLSALQEKKRILFCYTSEADIYNEMGNRYNDNMRELQKLRDYIIETYNYDNFTILAIHMNKTYEDCKIIANYRINVPQRFLSDDGTSMTPRTMRRYRESLKKMFQLIFRME